MGTGKVHFVRAVLYFQSEGVVFAGVFVYWTCNNCLHRLCPVPGQVCLFLPESPHTLTHFGWRLVWTWNTKTQTCRSARLTTLSSNTAERYIPMQRRAKEGAKSGMRGFTGTKGGLGRKIYERGRPSDRKEVKISLRFTYPDCGRMESL